MINNRALIFKRMGLSKPINEAFVPKSDSISNVISIFEQEDYFPVFNGGGIQFIRVSENPQEFENFKKMMITGWENISLPF